MYSMNMFRWMDRKERAESIYGNSMAEFEKKE